MIAIYLVILDYLQYTWKQPPLSLFEFDQDSRARMRPLRVALAFLDYDARVHRKPELRIKI